MALAQFLRRCRFPPYQRNFSSVSTPVIKENDVLLIRQEGSRYAKWHLTPPLRPGRRVKLSYGVMLPTEELIGRNVLERMRDEGGRRVEVMRPSLAGYVVHSKRIATPIYPQDAATIVSLLDLHPTRPGEEDEEDGEREGIRTVDSTPFEIFEAGTGMGSLTLHIARAIHAANPPIPRDLRIALPDSFLSSSASDPESSTPSSSSTSSEPTTSPSPHPLGGLSESDQASLESYRSSRRAIIHTLDKNPKHSQEAYKFIRNFRRAQYLPSIDFHTNTTISAFLTSRLSQTNNTPFLARAILDLPSAHVHAGPVIESLLPDGLLVVFAPSISQIAEFQTWCLKSGQKVRLERVLELPTSLASETMPDSGAGGRAWDVKVVRERGDGEWVQVMRPKVGDRVAGGGFVAVVRKVGGRIDEGETVGVEDEGLDSSGLDGAELEGAERMEVVSETVTEEDSEGSVTKSVAP